MSENNRKLGDELESGIDSGIGTASQLARGSVPPRPKSDTPRTDSFDRKGIDTANRENQGSKQQSGSTSNNASGNSTRDADFGSNGKPEALSNTDASKPGSQNNVRTPESRQNGSSPEFPDMPEGVDPNTSLNGMSGGGGNHRNNSAHKGSSNKANGNSSSSGRQSSSGGGGGVNGVSGSEAAGKGAGASSGASAGSSAASGAGSAAASGGTGAAAGATAGSVAGPAGTAAGAAAGFVVTEGIKLIFKIIVLIIFLVSIFMMQPSFMYDNSKAVHDRTTLEDAYNSYYDSVKEEYRKDIANAKTKAAAKALLWQSTLQSNPGATLEGTIKLSNTDASAINNAYAIADEIEWEYSVKFLRTDDTYLEAASTNINLVLSMIDIQKKNWFVQLWDWFVNSATGGWYSNFVTSVNTWWNGFWNDFIVDMLYSVSATVTYDEYEEIISSGPSGNGPEEDDDDGEDEETTITIIVATIEITYTFDLMDKGVGFYAEKLNMDTESIDRAAEMANYLGDLFGNINDDYFAWYVTPGYHQGAITGGTTGANIDKAIADNAEAIEGLHFDSSGNQVFPLLGYSQPPMSSPYGPRPFPPDPYHTGIDFAAPSGVPIVAITDGVVLFIAQHKAGFGNHIAVYHGDGVTTLYAHMSRFGSYRAGDPVNAGDIIGYVGRSGLSTGNHLHFQVHDGNQIKNPVGFFRVFDYLKPN